MFLKQSSKEDAQKLLTALIHQGKLATTGSIYKRIRPNHDGCIRTVLNPAGTETGRLSSSDTFLERSTNLQNLNKKVAKEGELFNVRQCIVPRHGKLLCEADYSSAERRLLAYLADEPTAINHIESGINTYKWFAAKLYDIPDYESIDKSSAEYFIGKMSILALDRGVGAPTLMKHINSSAHLTGAVINLPTARKAYAVFHETFPGYKLYFDKVGRELDRNNYRLANCLGRYRDFLGRRNTQRAKESIIREAVSFRAQAVGDIINAAIIKIYNTHDPHLLQLLLQVHDAIVWECDRDDLHASANAVKVIMEKPIQVMQYSVSIPVELSYSSKSWADMEDL